MVLQCGGQSGVWTASVIVLSIGSWVGRVGPRPADGETAHLTSPKERLETVRQVLSEVPLIDGHNDLPWNIRNFVHNQLADFDFEKDLRQVAPWSKSAWSQTDLVRLRQGMVGGQVISLRLAFTISCDLFKRWNTFFPLGKFVYRQVKKRTKLKRISRVRRFLKG